jgi:hypothetical protein
MIEKVEYIKSIFKIDADNPYVITDIADELVRVDHFDDYRKWLKSNVNHYDAQYLKPYEKFVFLTHKYLKQRLEIENSERITNGRMYALELSSKVKAVSNYVEEYGATYETLKLKGSDKELFSGFDKSQLAKVGGLISAVRLQKSISGTDALADKLEELAYELIVTNIIEYKPQKKTETCVSKLLDGVVEKI